MIERIVTPRKKRFSLVSALSTGLDFGILLLLTSLGMGTIAANYISSSIAFVLSFFAHKKISFKTNDRHIKREVPLFIIVTLTGIWGIQPVIIWAVQPYTTDLPVYGFIGVIIAKAIASMTTYIWNYLLYTRLVFRKKK